MENVKVAGDEHIRIIVQEKNKIKTNKYNQKRKTQKNNPPHPNKNTNKKQKKRFMRHEFLHNMDMRYDTTEYVTSLVILEHCSRKPIFAKTAREVEVQKFKFLQSNTEIPHGSEKNIRFKSS